jgi:hypothetical protein
LVALNQDYDQKRDHVGGHEGDLRGKGGAGIRFRLEQPSRAPRGKGARHRDGAELGRVADCPRGLESAVEDDKRLPEPAGQCEPAAGKLHQRRQVLAGAFVGHGRAGEGRDLRRRPRPGHGRRVGVESAHMALRNRRPLGGLRNIGEAADPLGRR